MPVTRQAVLMSLKGIIDPVSGRDINDAGLVRAITVEDDSVRLVLEINPTKGDIYEKVRQKVEKAILSLDGCHRVSAILTAHEDKKAPELKPNKKPIDRVPRNIPGVRNVIAVASGKGGVGKSTISANIACALAAAGKKVGLLDADVYGPSQPRIMGVSGRPSSPDGKLILPLRNHGVTVMSIGLMTKEGQAVVWRGPMLMGALQQMLLQVQWGTLDILIVDLPPGTGDVQLTLTQKVELRGAIIVSTPQDVALLDARKGIDMFRQMHTPLLGMIENMSSHICSRCGHEEHIFDHGGVGKEAEKIGIPLLAEIPLGLELRMASDKGIPLVISNPETAQAKALLRVADHIISTVISR